MAQKLFSRELFLNQVKKIMDEFGISDQDEFNKKIGIQRALTRWKGETRPSIDSLLIIKKVFGKSIDWLLTGEEPQKTGVFHEHPIETYEARPLAPVDTELISEVVKTVEEFLAKERLQISPERKGRSAYSNDYHCTRSEYPIP